MSEHSREFLRNIRPPYFDAFYFVDETEAPETLINAHVFFKVIFYLEGDAYYNIQGKRYDLIPGDILVTPRFTPYHRFNPTGNSYRRLIIWFTTELLDTMDDTGELRRFFEALDESKMGASFHFSPEVQSRIFGEARHLVSERDYDKPMGDMVAYSLISLVLVGIYRAAAVSHQVEEDSNASRLVDRVVEYINDHLLEDLSLDRLAEKFFISKFHLERVFKKQMSVTVHSYVVQRRLIRARQKLYDGAPPTKVHQLCGFSNYTTFYRAFEKMYGITPREFSRQAAFITYYDGTRSGDTVFKV